MRLERDRKTQNAEQNKWEAIDLRGTMLGWTCGDRVTRQRDRPAPDTVTHTHHTYADN